MNTADDFFMNHAFVSELWLFNALKQNWSHKEEWHKQMLDEKKHCAMTRGALKKNVALGAKPCNLFPPPDGRLEIFALFFPTNDIYK